MQGDINWAAVPWVAEFLGVDDLDAFVRLLRVIRDHRAKHGGPDTHD